MYVLCVCVLVNSRNEMILLSCRSSWWSPFSPSATKSHTLFFIHICLWFCFPKLRWQLVWIQAVQLINHVQVKDRSKRGKSTLISFISSCEQSACIRSVYIPFSESRDRNVFLSLLTLTICHTNSNCLTRCFLPPHKPHVKKQATGEELKRAKKQIYLPAEYTEEHHGHPHHHHPDAHFPANNAHHHHGTDQTDHTVDSHTHTITQPQKVILKSEHVDTSHQRTVKTEAVPGGYRTVVHTALNPIPTIHSHHGSAAYYAPHASHPGYPSSDYVRYYAKYTSNGGSPSDAAHSYYRDHNGHLYNYDVEPRYVQGKPNPNPLNYVPNPLADALHDADIPSSFSSGSSSVSSSSSSSTRSSKYHSFHPDLLASDRNFIAAGNSFHSRVETGTVDSPSGKGPHVGFYYGNRGMGGRIAVGDRLFRFWRFFRNHQ